MDKILKSHSSINEAEMDRMLLESEGIKCVVQKNGPEFPGSLGDGSGALLFVREEDIEKAKKLLSESNSM